MEMCGVKNPFLKKNHTLSIPYFKPHSVLKGEFLVRE